MVVCCHWLPSWCCFCCRDKPTSDSSVEFENRVVTSSSSSAPNRGDAGGSVEIRGPPTNPGGEISNGNLGNDSFQTRTSLVNENAIEVPEIPEVKPEVREAEPEVDKEDNRKSAALANGSAGHIQASGHGHGQDQHQGSPSSSSGNDPDASAAQATPEVQTRHPLNILQTMTSLDSQLSSSSSSSHESVEVIANRQDLLKTGRSYTDSMRVEGGSRAASVCGNNVLSEAQKEQAILEEDPEENMEDKEAEEEVNRLCQGVGSSSAIRMVVTPSSSVSSQEPEELESVVNDDKVRLSVPGDTSSSSSSSDEESDLNSTMPNIRVNLETRDGAKSPILISTPTLDDIAEEASFSPSSSNESEHIIDRIRDTVLDSSGRINVGFEGSDSQSQVSEASQEKFWSFDSNREMVTRSNTHNSDASEDIQKMTSHLQEQLYDELIQRLGPDEEFDEKLEKKIKEHQNILNPEVPPSTPTEGRSTPLASQGESVVAVRPISLDLMTTQGTQRSSFYTQIEPTNEKVEKVFDVKL